MRLSLLQCGRCDVGWDVLVPDSGRSGTIDLPVPMLLARTDGDTYLVDTGMPDEWINRTGDLDGEPIYPHMTAADAVDRQLAAVGLAVEDITVDAVYTATNWEEDRLGAMTDPAAGQASVERLRREAAQPHTTVIFGHDPAQWASLLHPPWYYS